MFLLVYLLVRKDPFERLGLFFAFIIIMLYFCCINTTMQTELDIIKSQIEEIQRLRIILKPCVTQKLRDSEARLVVKLISHNKIHLN